MRALIMRKFLFTISILLFVTISLWAMQPLKRKRSKVESKKIHACLSQISSNAVPKSIVEDASFSNKNSFEIGEKVIVLSHKKEYFYGCIVDIELRQSPVLFKIDMFDKEHGPQFTRRLANDIGKILPPSLVNLSIDSIVTQIKSRKLKLEDIEPPRLPKEVYERVLEALKES